MAGGTDFGTGSEPAHTTRRRESRLGREESSGPYLEQTVWWNKSDQIEGASKNNRLESAHSGIFTFHTEENGKTKHIQPAAIGPSQSHPRHSDGSRCWDLAKASS